DISLLVVLLRRDTPIASGMYGLVSAHPLRLVRGRAFGAGVSTRRDGVVRLFNGADVRPDHTVGADVEHLFREPLIHLTAVRRNADDRRHRRRNRSALDNLLSIEQVLEAVTQRFDVVGVVLRFEDDAVVLRGGELDRAFDGWRREGSDWRLPLLEKGDHGIEAHRGLVFPR